MSELYAGGMIIPIPNDMADKFRNASTRAPTPAPAPMNRLMLSGTLPSCNAEATTPQEYDRGAGNCSVPNPYALYSMNMDIQ